MALNLYIFSGFRRTNKDDNETRHASSSVKADYQVDQAAATGKRVIYFLPPAARGEKLVSSFSDRNENYEFDTAASNARTVATI